MEQTGKTDNDGDTTLGDRQTWGRDRGERKGNDTETGVTSTGDADD